MTYINDRLAVEVTEDTIEIKTKTVSGKVESVFISRAELEAINKLVA